MKVWKTVGCTDSSFKAGHLDMPLALAHYNLNKPEKSPPAPIPSS